MSRWITPLSLATLKTQRGLTADVHRRADRYLFNFLNQVGNAVRHVLHRDELNIRLSSVVEYRNDIRMFGLCCKFHFTVKSFHGFVTFPFFRLNDLESDYSPAGRVPSLIYDTLATAFQPPSYVITPDSLMSHHSPPPVLISSLCPN